ncbi:hypothetical protein E2562_034980 [Oryza meyeriana var. granulata]|uniref:Uncharacterized protein n=1 Tax=Oryza meyeriana var. granulata TaxID=110450 RepID=A0A6G1FFN5_9ORYZ|nr:hypothetical protein E2562_034980 [Oryza meyeriana var. granulata]
MEKKAGDSIPRQIARTSSSSRCGTDTESPSVYLVVGHGVTRPAYSVFKVPAGGGGGDSDSDDDTPVPLPPHPARLASKHCMCFVPVQSRHGPWIVGVGGNSARDYGPETIVFDTKTCKAIPGPKLLSTKLCPVLLTFGERIYALATMPAVTGDVNFVPWFEVLDLSMARVDDGSGCLVDCEWKALPRPPFFPWDLTPTDYIFPPQVTVKSHVAVGSYILLSITGQTGTHMFDVETEQWAKLDDKDLPFIGPAIPQGTLFLGLSNATEELTAYKINVCASAVASPSAITAGCLSLSIVEIQIVTNEAEEEIVSTGRFISLNYPAGNPGFCSFKWCNDDPLEFRISSLPQHVRELVTITAYSTVDYLESTRTLVISTQWKQVYSIYDPLRRLSSPCLQGIISF